MTRRTFYHIAAASQQGIIIPIGLNLFAPPPQRQNCLSHFNDVKSDKCDLFVQTAVPCLEYRLHMGITIGFGPHLPSVWMEPKYFSATDVVTVSYKTTCSVKVSRSLPRMTAELLMSLNHWNKQFDNCFTIKFYHQVLCLENCFIKISLALLKVSEQFTIDLFFFFSEATKACLLIHFFFIGVWEAFVKTSQRSVFFLSFFFKPNFCSDQSADANSLFWVVWCFLFVLCSD